MRSNVNNEHKEPIELESEQKINTAVKSTEMSSTKKIMESSTLPADEYDHLSELMNFTFYHQMTTLSVLLEEAETENLTGVTLKCTCGTCPHR